MVPIVAMRGHLTRHLHSIGPDHEHPKPILIGLGRLYRGLGVSAARSVITHGLLWTVIDSVSGWIDGLHRPPEDPAFPMT